jgi:hypothetical protein
MGQDYCRGHVCFQCDKMLCADCTLQHLYTGSISCVTCGCCQRDFCTDCQGDGTICGKVNRYANADPEKCYRFVCGSCLSDSDEIDGVPAMHYCSLGYQDPTHRHCCISYACRKCILRNVRRGIDIKPGSWTVRRRTNGDFWAACGKCMMDRKAAKEDAAKPK